MKYMIDGSSSAPVPKARRWLVQYPDASHTLLQLLTTKTIDYLVAQVKAGAQVCGTIVTVEKPVFFVNYTSSMKF